MWLIRILQDTNLAFVDIGMSRMRMRVATVYCHDAQTRFSSTPLLSNWHQPCEGYHNARLDIISSTSKLIGKIQEMSGSSSDPFTLEFLKSPGPAHCRSVPELTFNVGDKDLVDESLRNAGQDGCLSKDSLKTL